jgi:hypothetical protein
MADFAVSARLTADGTAFVGSMRESEAALKRLINTGDGSAEMFRNVDSGVLALMTDSNALSSANRQLQASYDPLRAAAQRYGQQLTQIEALLRGQQISTQQASQYQQAAAAEYERAANTAVAAGQRVEQSSGLQRNALRQLSFQVGDVAQSFALGINPMMIFAQQGDHVRIAVSDMFGTSSRFAAFMGGPWGAALFGAVTILGVLGAAAIRAGDDLNQTADAAERAANRIEEATRRLREYANQRDQVETTRVDIATTSAEVRRLQSREFALRNELDILRRQSPEGFDDRSRQVSESQLLSQIRERERLLTANIQRQNSLRLDIEGARTQERREAREEAEEEARREAEAAARRGETGGRRAARRAETAANREAQQAAREYARESLELERVIHRLVTEFEPLTAAHRDYQQQVEQLEEAQRRGLITLERKGELLDLVTGAYREQTFAIEENYRAEFARDILEGDPGVRDDIARIAEGERERERIDNERRDAWIEANRDAAGIFRDNILEAGAEFADLIGGKVGRALGLIFDIAASSSGAQIRGRGPLASFLNLANSPTAEQLFAEERRRAGDPNAAPPGASLLFGSEFSEGMREAFQPLTDLVRDLIDEMGGIFGDGGSFARDLGRLAGFAGIGAGFGSLTGSKLGGGIGGAIGGAGAEKFLSDALGSFAGPLGSIAGGLIGGLVGGLFGGSPKASSTISSVTGTPTASGSSKLAGTAVGLASSVQEGLQQIASALGAEIGGFNVSIGVRKDDFRVDPSGGGATKTKKGAIDFGQDQAAAILYAIADAIGDGAIRGVSAAVQQALRSSTNIDLAVEEALKVQEVEAILGGLGNEMEKAFKQFEDQARERVRIAQQYGFDVLAIEAHNAEERAKLVDDLLSQRTGALRNLLDNLSFGDLFEGSATERRRRLLDEIAGLIPKAEAGDTAASGRLAELFRTTVETSREAFGTAGTEFASDLAQARSEAERLIALEEERINAAQKASDETVSLLDENNGQNARMISLLEQLAAGGGSGQVQRPSLLIEASLQ